jgi:hypothetical protein
VQLKLPAILNFLVRIKWASDQDCPHLKRPLYLERRIWCAAIVPTLDRIHIHLAIKITKVPESVYPLSRRFTGANKVSEVWLPRLAIRSQGRWLTFLLNTGGFWKFSQRYWWLTWSDQMGSFTRNIYISLCRKTSTGKSQSLTCSLYVLVRTADRSDLSDLFDFARMPCGFEFLLATRPPRQLIFQGQISSGPCPI